MQHKNTQDTTVLVIVLGLLVLSYIFKASILILIATIIGIVAMVFPFVGKWIEWFWFKIAEVLGWINSRILLGLIFFVLLFPIALLYQWSKKDPLKLKKKKDTLFTDRNHLFTKKDIENMW